MPYGSARDLPKFREMQEQLAAMQPFLSVMPEKDRDLLKSLPAQLDLLIDTVDAFYGLLGPRNWVFHDDLDAEEMAVLVADHASDPDAAEQALIGWYQADERLSRLVRRLHGHEALHARMHLLRLAVEDYQAARFYAVVQVLLSVMDGFVNDVNPAKRKGLHAREPAEMDAWDSVVGHHLGLSSAHVSFTKTFKARIDQPVFELYRHGIVHGMITDYNNAIVATKAWNRLFAVADWARAREAEQREATKQPDPTWGDMETILSANAETKAALDAFTPVTFTGGDPALPDHEVYVASVDFLQAWLGNNYGRMAARITNASGVISPGEVRQDYQGHSLTEFQITGLNHHGAAVCTVATQLMVDGQEYSPELRWVRQGADGQVAAPNAPGEWRLVRWGHPHMVGGTQ